MKDSMSLIARRDFGALALLFGTRTRSLSAADGLDETLRAAEKRRAIPLAAAMVATASKTLYEGTFGKRDSASGIDATVDSIFRIASMTKPVTAVAAMQLVEQGKLALDEPVAKHLPQLGKLQVLEGFDKATHKPVLRPARKPVLLRHLLTHTSGFVYDNWDANLVRYLKHAALLDPDPVAPVDPLMFEPGTRWEYGTSMDWAGRLVEAVSGQTLEEYFQRNILRPLGMKDTSFMVPENKFDRLVNAWQRQGDGSLKESPRTPPAPPKSYNGGGGLNSTPRDYVRFMQMILRRGSAGDGQQILRPRTVDLMASNRIGGLSAGKLKSVNPENSSDVDFHPGFTDGFGFGFLINRKAYEGGRSAGSLAWAGIRNTFFWIDPRRGICAVLMMQFLPFCDREAMGLLHDFERSVYAAAPRWLGI
jgi:CubicO group peptidase (beta-lactamase class C family)